MTGGSGPALEPLRARLLGPTHIAVGDRVIGGDAWPRRGARMLLLLLLAAPGHRLPRDRALDLLWPEATADAALTALYTSMSAVRRVLEPDLRSGRESAYLEARGGNVTLRSHPGLWVDVDAFRAAIERSRGPAGAGAPAGGERADALREAVALYRGEFLGDEPYLDWAAASRERLQRDWREAVLDLAAIERDAGRPLAAVPALEAVLEADPTDEAAHRALIAAFAAAGRPADAARQYERCVRRLRDDLDAEPDPETTALAATIASSPAVSAVAHRMPLHPEPLPVPPTPIVGRAADLTAVDALLAEPGVRLVTLVGPGGIGKSRMALEAGRRAAPRFADGAGFVPLAAISDARLVVPAIAAAVGISERRGGQIAEQLRDALYGREVLLVIDNVEQVIDAALDVATVLEGSPGLRLLVTSREPLHVRAEHVHQVGPLPVPAPGDESSAEALAGNDAVALFIERVRAVRPGFAIDAPNAPVVAAICARLEGLPLALELGAARCRHLSPEALLARLDRRLPVLVGGARDLPDRLRTMRAAIAWSHDLLSASQQVAFRRLAPFAGGATLEAAAAVLSVPHGFTDADVGDPGEAIAGLVDQSLVRYKDDDRQRVGMLETIREFARERLVASGEAPEIDEAHARFFLDWAQSIAHRLGGPGEAVLLDRLEREHGNLRAAYDTLMGLEDPEPVLRLAGALGGFWGRRGHIGEGRRRLDLALARKGAAPIVRARALVRAADLAEGQGDVEPAEAMYRDALAVFEAAGDVAGIGETSQGLAGLEIGRTSFDAAAAWAERALEAFERLRRPRGLAYAVNSLATIAFWRGDHERASELWKRCVGLLAEAGDERARGIALSNIGVVDLQRGDLEAAVAHHREALAIARGIGDPTGVTHPLLNLGRVLVLTGDHAGAGPVLEEALENTRALGNVAWEATARQTLAQSALATGDLPAAAEHLIVSNELVRRAGSGILAAANLEAAAAILRRRGDAPTAARLLGAAEAVWAEIGGGREAADEPAWQEDVRALGEALDANALEAAWAAGRSMTRDVALVDAIDALRAGAALPGHAPAAK